MAETDRENQAKVAELEHRLAVATRRIISLESELEACARARSIAAGESCFRELVERSPEPMVVHVDEQIAYANAAAARAIGLTDAAALVGRSILEYTMPATRKTILKRLRSDPGSGPLEVVEQGFIHPVDGDEIHAEVKSVPITYQSQDAILSVARDITRRVIAERESAAAIRQLEFERERFGSLLQHAPAFVALTRGRDHVFELANDAYCALVGRDDLIGKPTIDAIPEVRSQGYIEMLDAVFLTGTTFAARASPVTLRVRGESVQRFVDFSCQRVVEVDGTVSGLITHGIDVTDLTKTAQRLRAQFNGVPVPTYVWQRVEREGRWTFVLIDFNVAASAIARNGIAKFLGATAEAFFATSPEIIVEMGRCLANGESITREMDRTLITTGETKRLVVTYAPVPPDLIVIHTVDVTERRTLETQLRQSQKMDAVGRLAGGVAHDFNNILSVILSYTEMQLDALPVENPVRADLVEIHNAGLRAVGLTRQLLAFSRKQVLEPRVLDLSQTVQGLGTMLRRVLGEDITLSILPSRVACHVSADPGQVEQVLMNLVVNARDAMLTGGKLTIETVHVDLDEEFAATHLDAGPGPYVMLTVSDTGVGMDEATRLQIFEPFFTTKGPNKGTGLGLATVFGIVQQSGGSIWVYSEPGQGTTFKIYLPRIVDAVIPDTTPPVSLPTGGNETILLVEDDESVRILARTVLQRAGYVVLETANGGEAFLVCEEYGSAIHLLVTDVVMPRMSGRKLAERLVALRPSLKVLYMSGYTDDAVIHHGILEPGIAFIQKPITAHTLLTKVRKVLARSTPVLGIPADTVS